MIKIVCSFFVLSFIVCSNSFANINIINKKNEKINAAQVFVIDEKYKNNVGLFFKEAKAKGVNTVFFRVFHNAGDRYHFNIKSDCRSGLYFKDDNFCTVNDILSPIIKAAHNNGIKLYAWVATRSLTDLKSENLMSKSFSPEGNITLGYGANIFHNEVRSKIISLFESLSKYNIDGILFQDDFIMKYSEGADNIASELFFAETGIKASPEIFFKGTKEYNGKKTFTGLKDEFYVWANWKANHLSKLFEEIKLSVKKNNPNISFAVNIYYETPISAELGLAWYSQKIPYLLEKGADYLAVMGYHEQIAKEMNKSVLETSIHIGDIARAANMEAKKYGKNVIMKLQTLSFDNLKQRTEKDIFKNLCLQIHKTDNINIAVVPIFEAEDIYSECFKK